MHIKHREVCIKPDHENGNRLIKAVPCAYVLPLRHYTRALKSRKTHARRVSRSIHVERKVASSNPTRGLCLFCLNFPIIVVTMCLFCAWWNLIIVIVREFTWLCVYCTFTSENIIKEKELYIKNSVPFSVNCLASFSKQCLLDWLLPKMEQKEWPVLK